MILVWSRPSPTLPFCAIASTPMPGQRGSIVSHCDGRWEPAASDEFTWSPAAEERCGRCWQAVIGGGARILELARQHDVITSDELPLVLDAISVYRHPLDRMCPILAEPEEPDDREEGTPPDDFEIEVTP